MASASSHHPVFFESACAFRAWLAQHAHAESELLVGYYKVGTGHPTMSWSDSVDEALCYGWIDGVRKRIDDERYQIRFTPRKPSSIWSDVNIRKFHALSAEGRMTAAGAAAFARRTAQKSRVYAYEQEDEATLSAAERAAFMGKGGAWAYFNGTPPSYQKVVLHWVTQAKRPETRAARFQKLLAACSTGERLR